MPPLTGRYTAFEGSSVVAAGALIDVALVVKARGSATSAEPVLVFDDATGAVVDLDLRGSPADIFARLATRADQPAPEQPSQTSSDKNENDARGRGRPKLGVVAREVTLLPRQWEWLASQPGGASQALRRLVDEARRQNAGQDRIRVAREAAYRFMSAMAGNLPGFEAATRALFVGDRHQFRQATARWPDDVAAYASRLAMAVFPPEV